MRYTKKEIDRLKIRFNLSEKIDENYSQVMQDIFVLSCLNGKRDGFFLEIGCNHPTENSNTYLLESKYNWKGISIDIIENEDFRKFRKSSYFVKNALELNYGDFLEENKSPNIIDYLSLDIEPGTNTLACLERIPMDKYRFRVITFEHDYYSMDLSESERVRSRQREILGNLGYTLIAGNISNYGSNGVMNSFEDWWVDPNLVDIESILILSQKSDDNKYPMEILYK
jgi:hypothetical protein